MRIEGKLILHSDKAAITDLAELQKAFDEYKYKACIRALAEVKTLLGKDSKGAALLARVARAGDRINLERALWRWGIRNNPGDQVLVRGLANAYQGRGRLIAAEELLKGALGTQAHIFC